MKSKTKYLIAIALLFSFFAASGSLFARGHDEGERGNGDGCNRSKFKDITEID